MMILSAVGCSIIKCKENLLCESPPRGRLVNSVVLWKNDSISGVAGMHVSCICISVYSSLQQGPSTQTMKFRMQIWFHFWAQSVLRGATSLAHSVCASCCLAQELQLQHRAEPQGQPQLLANCIPLPLRRSAKNCQKITEGENSKSGQGTLVGVVLFIFFLICKTSCIHVDCSCWDNVSSDASEQK